MAETVRKELAEKPIAVAGTEIGQSFTTYRSGDPMDFLADFTALASTSVITLLAELLIFKNKR